MFRKTLALCSLALVTATIACRSRGIDVTIQNNAQVPLRNVEFDYPGGAFGTGVIAPGKSYWYHIKPSADGDFTVSFDRDNGTAFRQKGAQVHPGRTGRMIVLVDQDANKQWHIRVDRR